jgi:hypothetical protein
MDGHVARMGGFWLGNLKGKLSLGTPGRRWRILECILVKKGGKGRAQ